MIKSKEDYYRYLKQDQLALNRKTKGFKLLVDEVWKFERLLRKLEYYINCKRGMINTILTQYYKFKFHKLSVRLGFTIAPNVFEEGLSIAHYGTIVVHSNAQVGKNCRLQEGVNIGTSGGGDRAPKIGDNCFIGTGAKIIGAVTIADDVAIGAGAVVTKDILEFGTTWGGVPAKKISNKNSHCNLNVELFR